MTWFCTEAARDGSTDAWIYSNQDKSRKPLASVERITNGMYRWRIAGTNIQGTATTRTEAMQQAREEYERTAGVSK